MIPARTSQGRTLHVRAVSRRSTRGHVTTGGMSWPCALGRSGCRVIKREGDGATPCGTWRLDLVLYRPDRGPPPATRLPVRALRPSDGWCDDAADRHYNRWVQLPYTASAETLWREDAVYDLIVVLSHNRRPRRRGGGSAIFMHLARPNYAPTQGCLALSERDLRLILSQARVGTRIVISA